MLICLKLFGFGGDVGLITLHIPQHKKQFFNLNQTSVKKIQHILQWREKWTSISGNIWDAMPAIMPFSRVHLLFVFVIFSKSDMIHKVVSIPTFTEKGKNLSPVLLFIFPQNNTTKKLIWRARRPPCSWSA